jgi:hypothetical protein
MRHAASTLVAIVVFLSTGAIVLAAAVEKRQDQECLQRLHAAYGNPWRAGLNGVPCAATVITTEVVSTAFTITTTKTTIEIATPSPSPTLSPGPIRPKQSDCPSNEFRIHPVYDPTLCFSATIWEHDHGDDVETSLNL